jgi:hypothetical protein
MGYFGVTLSKLRLMQAAPRRVLALLGLQR